MGVQKKTPYKKNKKKVLRDVPPQVELLEDDGECTRAFKHALVELFARFDVDGNKLLSEAELKAFSKAANEDEREFTEAELLEIREYFDWKEGPDGSGLSLRGWMQMYMTQTQGEEEETWKDLRRLGYNGQLKMRTTPNLKAEGKLLKKLMLLIELGEAGKFDEFVDAFVAPDVEMDDRQAFLETLRGNSVEADTAADDVGQLQGLLAELRVCMTGEGVTEVEGCQEKGPVVFKFASPAPGMDNIDREVEFVKEGEEWYAEG